MIILRFLSFGFALSHFISTETSSIEILFLVVKLVKA